jgi:hypothetical protein
MQRGARRATQALGCFGCLLRRFLQWRGHDNSVHWSVRRTAKENQRTKKPLPAEFGVMPQTRLAYRPDPSGLYRRLVVG